MNRANWLALLLGAVMVCAVSVALASPAGEFDNICAEGLALGQVVHTDCSINTMLDGKTYCFGNEQAKELFMKDPEGNLAKAKANFASKKE